LRIRRAGGNVCLQQKKLLTAYLRAAHEVCEKGEDVASTSLIEVRIDETERRAWFLGEIVAELD
jgi:starvation-inducible DNA-binding protein